MSVQGLGYIGVRSATLEDWGEFGSNLLGLQRIDKSRSSLAFRMDDRKQRIVIEEGVGEGIKFFGWEVNGPADLDAIAAGLEKRGIAVTRGNRALAEQRHVADLILFSDPVGNRIEVFHGPEITDEAFRPGRSISGFRTGPLGMGHAVLTVENTQMIGELTSFYSDLLGFNLTDYYSNPFEARFLHVNRRHHSLAFVGTGKNGFHHLMMELFSFDDVGSGYDIANGRQGCVETTLGRHTSDYLTSFYTGTPSKFMVEYGWGGRSIDTDTWEPYERNEGPSLWGHDRTWTTPEQNAKARDIRAKASASGPRPVQVMEGNYEVLPGVCPWWDQMKAGSR